MLYLYTQKIIDGSDEEEKLLLTLLYTMCLSLIWP